VLNHITAKTTLAYKTHTIKISFLRNNEILCHVQTVAIGMNTLSAAICEANIQISVRIQANDSRLRTVFMFQPYNLISTHTHKPSTDKSIIIYMLIHCLTLLYQNFHPKFILFKQLKRWQFIGVLSHLPLPIRWNIDLFTYYLI
jgi:hypothetical protein